MPPEPLDLDQTALTPTGALGVALSVAQPALIMDDAQRIAGELRSHLRELGFDVTRIEPVIRPPGHAVEAMKRALG